MAPAVKKGKNIPLLARLRLGRNCEKLKSKSYGIRIVGAWVMERQIKVLVEKHPDGYVAYPLGLKGVIVGEGET